MRGAAPRHRRHGTCAIAAAALAAAAVTGASAAPPAPSSLRVERATGTALGVSWSAVPGARRYRVYRDGVPVAVVRATRTTLYRLSCGRAYVVAVRALDAAGRQSARVSRRAATAKCAAAAPAPPAPVPAPAPPPAPAPAPPPAPVPVPSGGGGGGGGAPPPPPPAPPPPPPPAAATVFLAPAGSDANACTQAAPCRSFDRAYRVAAPGDVVEVAAGSYGDQNLRFDPSKTSSADVVFRPAAGAAVTIGQLDFGANRLEGGASHVTVEGMTVTEDVAIPGCGVPDNTACPPDAQSPGDDLTFRDLRVKGPYAFYCASCSNVSLLGGTWGPDTWECRAGFGSAHPEIQSAYTQVKRAHGILIDGVMWQNFARCSGGDHTECLQVEPADDLTIRNSVFRNCDTMAVNIANDLANSNSPAGYRAPNNVLVENNVFAAATDFTGGPTYYALNVRECTNCTVRYNSWLQAPRMPTGEVSLNNRWIGNVGPMEQAGCGVAGVLFSHNVWEGASCGATDRNVADALFAGRAALDLHLRAGSPALDAGDAANAPATDAEGRTRGAPPDAGAFER